MSDVTAWLDDAAARADAATEGPWIASLAGQGARVSDPSGYSLPGCFTCGQNEDGIYEPPDAAFIAHARTDLPAAIAALRAVLDLVNSGGEFITTVADGEHIPRHLIEQRIATALGVTP